MALSTLYWLLGFFVTFPFLYIPLPSLNLRLDDLFVFIIFFFAWARPSPRVHKKAFLTAIVFLSFLIIGFVARSFTGIDYDNYPLIRIFGITVYIFVLSISATQGLIEKFFRGVVVSSILFLLMAFAALLYHLANNGFEIDDLYTLKDSLYIFGPFNPNTYGAMMVFSSFCAWSLYKINNDKKFAYLAIIFLLFPFLYLIKRDMIGVFFALIYLYAATRRLELKASLYLLGTLGAFAILALIIELWDNPTFIRLMAHRVAIYSGAFASILESPMGHGIGSEINVLYPITGRPLVSHNSFLSMGIELGVIPTLIFLLLLLYVFCNLRNVWVRFYFLVFFIESFFGNGFYFYKYHFLFLGICILNFRFCKKDRTA